MEITAQGISSQRRYLDAAAFQIVYEALQIPSQGGAHFGIGGVYSQLDITAAISNPHLNIRLTGGIDGDGELTHLSSRLNPGRRLHRKRDLGGRGRVLANRRGGTLRRRNTGGRSSHHGRPGDLGRVADGRDRS
jgi:hypothetical protein